MYHPETPTQILSRFRTLTNRVLIAIYSIPIRNRHSKVHWLYMQRNTYISIAVVLVVIAGITLYVVLHPVPTGPAGEAAIILPAGGYSEHTKYYDISASYATSTPLLKSAGASADATARSLMLGFVRDTIYKFKTDGNFANLTSTDIKAMGLDQGRKETLQIIYRVASSPHTVSYIFTIYEDTLGAHGNTFFRTGTFNMKTGAPLALANIFSPGTTYLNTLSSISRAKLPGIIGQGADMTFIKNGTEPKAENFQSFYLDANNFIILFDPYAVAPYSSGPQTLRIPLSQLSSILKPEYR